jgi:ribosomal protein S18 acetylase RimI-like enzyme
LPELRAAYALVHDVFVGTGYIHPEAGGIRLRIFEACPETATFIAKKEGEVVGVLSVVLDSHELGLPSDAAFKVELDSLRKTGARLCEVTNQAVAKEYRRSALLTELMRCAIAYMLNAGCDRAIATVSPNHSGFYQFVGFDQLGAERSYSKKLHDPVVALCGDLSLLKKARSSFATQAEEYVYNFMTRAHRFRGDAAERSRRAKQHFLSAELLEGLLLGGRNFFTECSLSELLHLRSSWGRELFDLVWETSGSELSADTAFTKAPHLSATPNSSEIQDDWAGFKELFREYFSPNFSWLGSNDMAMES